MKNFSINKISLKLGLLFSGIFLILLLLLGYILYGLFSNMFIEYVSQELLIHGENHSKVLEENYNIQTLKYITLTEKNLTTSVIITDYNNQIIAYSEQVTDEMNKYITLNNFYQHSQIINNDWRNNPNIASVSPIKSGELGYVYMFYSTKSLNEIVFILRFFVLIASIGIIMIAIGIISLISAIMTKPLLTMQSATNEMAKGNFIQKIEFRGNDEISQLASSIQKLGDQLHYYEHSRNEFLTNISHELRTPLTYIKGYSDVLLKNFVRNKKEQDIYLTIIRDETRRVNHLVNDLFELSKIQTRQLKIDIKSINIVEILERTINILTPLATKKGINILFEKDLENISVKVDSARMEQVFYNLIENAVKYTEKGNVRISLVQKNDVTTIVIEDTGIGIPNEDLSRIWERFYRVEKSRSRLTGGSGLGLYIVKEIIQLHHGTIEITSVEGKGTKIIIHLNSKEVIT